MPNGLSMERIRDSRLITHIGNARAPHTRTENIYTNTVLRGSVILSVRYINHFPVVQFQNQAHIWNPHGTGHVFKTIWGAAGAP